MDAKKGLHGASCQLVVHPNPCFPDGRLLQPHLGWGEALCFMLAFFVSMFRPPHGKHLSPWTFSLPLIYCLKIAALPISYQPSAGKDLRKMDRRGFYVALPRNNC